MVHVEIPKLFVNYTEGFMQYSLVRFNSIGKQHY
jgi:hypothetical protein